MRKLRLSDLVKVDIKKKKVAKLCLEVESQFIISSSGIKFRFSKGLIDNGIDSLNIFLLKIP